MNRLQQKCLIASACLHGFLVLLIVFGSAFLAPSTPPKVYPTIRVVPALLVDDLLAGGGGDPKIPITEDRQKGDTLKQQPLPPAQPAPPKPPPPVKRQPEAPPKLELILKTRNGTLDVSKDTKSKADAKLKATERQREREAAQARAAAEARKQLAKDFGRSIQGLSTGFKDGTKVRVGGPGGVAYANYASYVWTIFDNAWEVGSNVAEAEGIVTVQVIVARDGRFLSKRIIERSGIALLDRSVQRALDAVTSLPRFPEGSTDDQRTFNIDFNLKAKRLGT